MEGYVGRNVVALYIVVVAAIGLLLAACGDEDAGFSLDPATHTIYMAAVEPKGSATVDKEPFPDAPLPQGGGYALKEPGADGKWEVETYAWSPEQFVVIEGDTVNLEILGVNGTRHEASIEGYVDSFVVERGKLTSLSFVAETPGVFKIVCTTHKPSMTGEILVLPRN